MKDTLFRNVMGKFATGVTAILVNTDDGYHGMTANAFMSVSLEPKQFSVNILSGNQVGLAKHFAKQQENCSKIEVEIINAVPILKNALASVTCSLYDAFEAGDHTLFLGEVNHLQEQDGDPLIFH